jgi:hypothetical protein
MSRFTHESARKARCRKAGLAAARFWRQYGFANLEKARTQRRLNAARRRSEREASGQHMLVFPHGLPHVWYCSCGLLGRGQETVVPLHREALGLDPPGSSGQRIVRVPTAALLIGD